MLGAIVSMEQQLDLAVIAEGIEEAGQLERLHGLGALAGQGYFARPGCRAGRADAPPGPRGTHDTGSEGDRTTALSSVRRPVPHAVPGRHVARDSGAVALICVTLRRTRTMIIDREALRCVA